MSRYRWVILGAGTLAQASFSARLRRAARARACAALALPPLARPDRRRARRGRHRDAPHAAAVGPPRRPDRRARRDRRSGSRRRRRRRSPRGRARTRTARSSSLLVLAGALGASVNAASGRAVMGWFHARERGLALGIRQTAIPIGGAAAAAGLPWLASTRRHPARVPRARLRAASPARSSPRRSCASRRPATPELDDVDAAAPRPAHVAARGSARGSS